MLLIFLHILIVLIIFIYFIVYLCYYVGVEESIGGRQRGYIQCAGSSKELWSMKKKSWKWRLPCIELLPEDNCK